MTTPLTFENTKKVIDTKDYRIQINEAGTGHPILMIHGGGPGATGWSNFAPNIPVLSQKYRCIAVTMPGWGESSPQSVETGRDQVAAIIQLMDTMGIDRATCVGNSMGGAIAIQTTARHPERVAHLITMGSGLGIGNHVFSPGVPPEGIRVLVDTYQDPSPANFKRLVQVMCYDSSNATDGLADERSTAALEFPEHNTNFLNLWHSGVEDGTWRDATAELKQCTVPTLAIHGRNDRTMSFEASLRLVSTVPNSRLVLLNRCGHWAQLEHADEFNRLVDGFIANN